MVCYDPLQNCQNQKLNAAANLEQEASVVAQKQKVVEEAAADEKRQETKAKAVKTKRDEINVVREVEHPGPRLAQNASTQRVTIDSPTQRVIMDAQIQRVNIGQELDTPSKLGDKEACTQSTFHCIAPD